MHQELVTNECHYKYLHGELGQLEHLKITKQTTLALDSAKETI